MRPCRPLLTTTDHEQLIAYVSDSMIASIADHESLAMLRSVLRDAKVVEDSHVEPDVVTLDSEFQLRDIETGEVEQYTLVLPDEADIARGRLSVLAPLGASLLGQSVGSTVRIPCPLGVRTVTVERLLYQPEAAEKRLHGKNETIFVATSPVATIGCPDMPA